MASRAPSIASEGASPGSSGIWQRVIEVAAKSDDPAIRRQARLLSALLVVMTVVFLAVDTAFVLTRPGYEPPWYGYVFLLATFATNRAGYYRLASSVVVAMFPLVAFSHVAFGQAADPVVTLSYLMLSPLLGAILVPVRGVLLLAAVNIVGILLLPAVAPQFVPRLLDLVGPLSGNAISGALCVLYMHHRNQIEADRQRRLRISEERLRFALGAAQMGTWDWDLTANTTSATPRAREIFGYVDEDRFTTDPDGYFSRVHPQDLERVRAVFDAAISGEAPEIHIEHRIVRIDGEQRYVDVSGRAVRDDSGKPTRVLGIVVDVTEQRELAEGLHRAQRMEAIGRLAGGVAHDFNNLLTVIRGNAAVLRQRGNSQELDDISTAARSAVSLTQQLLAFSRHGVVETQVTDLSSTVRESVKLLRRVIGEDIEIVVEAKEGLWLVEVDERQIHQCLLNLATNARDAMPDGGTLRLRTINVPARQGPNADAPADYVAISVTDAGTGMDALTRAKALEPFFTSKEPGRGTGLGLSMVFAAVKGAGGHVEIESAPGEGTTVCLYFPRAHGQARERSADEEPQSEAGNESILVVEDDAFVRRIVGTVLERVGYRVTAVGDVEAAQAAFEREKPGFSLLISDVILSRSTGPELAADLRTRDPGLRVLFMTGYAPEATLKDNPVADAEAIQKPFDPGVFLRKVRRLIDAAPDRMT